MRARIKNVLMAFAENPPHWIVRLFGQQCMYCKELTLGTMRWGNALDALRLPLCEPCHQRECPEVPHP